MSVVSNTQSEDRDWENKLRSYVKDKIRESSKISCAVTSDRPMGFMPLLRNFTISMVDDEGFTKSITRHYWQDIKNEVDRIARNGWY